MVIKDSGTRREFETGALRDIPDGKGRCDLLPLDIVADILGSKELSYIYKFTVTGGCEYLLNTLHEFSKIYIETTDRAKLASMMLEISIQFEEGAKKYGDNNWRKGIPAHCYIDSAVRHYLKWVRGDNDERHDRAFAWNIICCIWTCQNKPELNDYV